MRFTLFRRLQQVRAIYLSATPLFAFEEGVDPIVPTSFRSDKDGTVLRFAPRGRQYLLGGGSAWPGTVTLIPVAGQAHLHIFQQSDGMGTTFYGALRLRTDHPGFDLFSPEGARAAALDAAIGNGATPSNDGYVFTSRAQLLAALVPVALEAPAAAWDTYRLI